MTHPNPRESLVWRAGGVHRGLVVRPTTEPTYKKANNTLLIGYAATYDNAGRLSQIVGTPSNDATTYSYDNADRLLSEV